MTRRKKVTRSPISPLTGPLDTRSLPNLLANGSLRYRQNFRTIENGKLCRGDGWSKFLTSGAYNNQDLHDQLRVFTGGPRQPIIFQKEFQSSSGVKYYFAATQGAIYRLNSNSGNWMVLGSGYGNGTASANDYRWNVSQVGDYLTWTNGYNKPFIYAMEQASFGNPPLRPITDLDLIGLTRAALTWSWRNVNFLADVDMDGQRFAYRIVWGDYANPSSYDPAVTSSIAGSQDLQFDERILGGLEAQDRFLIYTTHAIWAMQAVGGDQSFSFTRIFTGDENHQKCLFYPNTLVSSGVNHFYMGKDRIYSFNIYSLEPSVATWLDNAAGTLYENLDQNACNSHHAFVDQFEIYFSVAKVGDVNNCPSITLRGNNNFQVADYIDHGFTSFGHHRPGNYQNIRDWLIDNRICTIESLTASGMGYVNEGLPAPFPTPSARFTPTSIYTSTPLTIDGVTTEDYTKNISDQFSLCNLLGAERFDDICRQCDSLPLFVGCSSQDWCLKTIGGVFYREQCTNTNAVGTTGSLGYTSSVGSYLLNGFNSILRFPPGYAEGMNLRLTLFKIDYIPSLQATPSTFQLRIGLAGQLPDPNAGTCALVWRSLSPKPMKCLSDTTPAQSIQNNTTPQGSTKWNFDYQAKYVCVELTLGGVGGAGCFSGVDGEESAVSIRHFDS